MNYIYKNWILLLIVFSSVILNIYLLIVIIDKSITENYQKLGANSDYNIIEDQEILLEFCWKGMDKQKVISLLNNILNQKNNSDLFVADKHENLIVFSNINFYFKNNVLEKITRNNLDEKFTIEY